MYSSDDLIHESFPRPTYADGSVPDISGKVVGRTKEDQRSVDDFVGNLHDKQDAGKWRK